jgi:hypothetical protein
MRAVQCRSCRLILCQAVKGFIGDPRPTGSAPVCRLLLTILLFVSLVTLLPLASADPSDPSWLIGIYNEADGDSVAWLIDSMALRIHPKAGIEGKPDSDVNRPLGASEVLHYPSVSRPAIISLIASPSRAPPLPECDGVPSPLPVDLLGTRKHVIAVQAFDTSHVDCNDETGMHADSPSVSVRLVPWTPHL